MMHDRFLWSRANYWIGLVLDLVVSTVGLAIGALVTPIATACVTLVAGLVAYTLYEYVLHRWLYHGRGYVARIHATHHDDPRALIGAPVYFSLGFAAVHGLGVGLAAGAAVGLIFGCALLFGYGQQSAIHHVAHGWPHTGRLLARSRLRKHHLVHHHDGACNYGISTRIWDHVFGTAVTTTEPRRSTALAPRPLHDAERRGHAAVPLTSMTPGA